MNGNSKATRHEAILDLIRSRRLSKQDELREALHQRGIDVTQATLSRDLRELRVVKVSGADGKTAYTLPDEWEHSAPLARLLPTLFLSAEGTDNLVVVRTMTGAAQAVARGIDWEEWPDVLGTIAGDDTILVVLRSRTPASTVVDRIEALARNHP